MTTDRGEDRCVVLQAELISILGVALCEPLDRADHGADYALICTIDRAAQLIVFGGRGPAGSGETFAQADRIVLFSV